MWTVRGKMGWTRAFHNTGGPHNSILRSTYHNMSRVTVWIHRKSLERLSDTNQSATESLLSDSMRNHETLL